MSLSRLTSKQKKGLIIAAIAVGGFFAVFIPFMIFSNPNLPRPVSLAITASNTSFTVPFFFKGNDSRVISYSLSIPSGKQVNISIGNNFGTTLRATISRTQQQSQCWLSTDSCVQILDPTDQGASPTITSRIFTALVDTQLCISMRGISTTGRWSEAGGNVSVVQTFFYQNTTLPTGQTNVTNVDLGGSQNVQYFQEFSVATSGYYIVRSNASSSGGAPNAVVQILLKGQGVASDIANSMSGAATEICMITHSGSPSNNHFTIAYLESGRTYILRYSLRGFINITSWELITPLKGVTDANGVTLDFNSPATTATVFQNPTDATLHYMFVDFGTSLQYHTLYDINVSADPYPDHIGVSLFPGDMAWSWTTLTTGAYFTSGRSINILFLNDQCEPLVKDGQSQLRSHQYIINIPSTSPWNNFSLRPSWSTSLNAVPRQWFMEHQLVTVVFDGTNHPSNVKLSFSPTSAGIPAFPQGPEQNGVYNTTFTFRNNGAAGENGVGLYKISGRRDSEFQGRFTQMDNWYNMQPNFIFFTAKGTSGARNQAGTYTISVTNTTRTWGGANIDWDTPIVKEMCLMEDPVYVVFNGTYSATAVSNITSFRLEYNYEPFPTLNTPFTVSRDNNIQMFKPISMPMVAAIQAYLDYGGCCRDIVDTSTVTILPTCPCLGISLTDATMEYSSRNPEYQGFPGSFGAYVIWLRSTLNTGGSSGYFDGAVLRLNVWSSSGTDWLAWGCFIGAAAGLAVVGLMFWKRKFIRVR